MFLCTGSSIISIENASDECVVGIRVAKGVKTWSKNLPTLEKGFWSLFYPLCTHVRTTNSSHAFSIDINDDPVHKNIQTYLAYLKGPSNVVVVEINSENVCPQHFLAGNSRLSLKVFSSKSRFFKQKNAADKHFPN